MQIKDLFIILPTIGAISALIIKLMTNFLKILVKGTYRNVPGEDSILPIVSKVVFSFIVTIVILIITTIILAIFNNKLLYLFNVESENILTNMLYKFVVISNIALPIATVILVIQYINLFKLNLISYHPVSPQIGSANNICVWGSGFYLIIVIICILDYIEKGIFWGNNNTNTLIIYGIYLLTIFLINYNLKKGK